MVVTKNTAEVDSDLTLNEPSPEMEASLATLTIDKPNINDRKKHTSQIQTMVLTHTQKNLEDSMFKAILPENTELETENVGSFHWYIEDWKALETKTHSPVFHVNGFPW